MEDFDKLVAFYKHVIDNTDTMPIFCRWVYGLHPDDELITEYINSDSMYLVEEDGRIIAAAAVTPNQDEDYHEIQWDIEAKDDEVSVIHILCVDPLIQHRGIAKIFVREIMAFCKATGKKAIRLDSLDTNKPSQKLYESLGFLRHGVRNWYACNLGYADFILYEYVL